LRQLLGKCSRTTEQYKSNNIKLNELFHDLKVKIFI